MAGLRKPLCGESLWVNTVNHNHIPQKKKRNSLNLFLKLIGETYFCCDLKEIRLLNLSRDYYRAHNCAFGASFSVCYVGNLLNLHIIRKRFFSLKCI